MNVETMREQLKFLKLRTAAIELDEILAKNAGNSQYGKYDTIPFSGTGSVTRKVTIVTISTPNKICLRFIFFLIAIYILKIIGIIAPPVLMPTIQPL